jgi:hypothetical protein
MCSGRNLKRHVTITLTHKIDLTFRRGVSKKKEQMAVVEEALGTVGKSDGNPLYLAKALNGLCTKI